MNSEASPSRRALGVLAPYSKINIDGVSLAYSDTGRGPTILCLHALGHGGGDYAALVQKLGRDYRLVVLDFPGHGNSDDDTEPASSERYARLALAFIAALDLEPVIVLGHALGGAVAIRCARENPQVRGLVLVSPRGLARPTRFLRAAARAMARLARAGAGVRGALFKVLYAVYNWWALPSADHRARIVAAGSEMAPVLARAWQHFADFGDDLRALAGGVGPALLVWGARDRVTPWHRSREAAQRFMRAELRLFDARGAPHLERPDDFAAALSDFLRKILDVRANPPRPDLH